MIASQSGKASRSKLTVIKNPKSLYGLENMIVASWDHISPIWPLNNLVATNPLAGYEDNYFNHALAIANGLQIDLTGRVEFRKWNIETIKWSQVLLDNLHASIKASRPNKRLLVRLLDLLSHENHSDVEAKALIKSAKINPDQAIELCLNYLEIPHSQRDLFLTLQLTTLPGWAGYAKYLAEKEDKKSGQKLLNDYLALRVILCALCWPEARELIEVYSQNKKENDLSNYIKKINDAETSFQSELISKVAQNAEKQKLTPEAQFVFCIDPRSELMRRHIESLGDYITYGYAGFFGIPLKVVNDKDDHGVNACPGMLKPLHTVKLRKNNKSLIKFATNTLIEFFSRSYQVLKYTFHTPFLLVDLIGFYSGFKMIAKTFVPGLGYKHSDIGEGEMPELTLDEKCRYAEQMLRTIGLQSHFAKMIILCGHESHSKNNAYAGALDCGACGGMSGYIHANFIADIMNDKAVRKYLLSKNIRIPDYTIFYPAIHITSTDELKVLSNDIRLLKVKEHLNLARQQSQIERLSLLNKSPNNLSSLTNNWAQVRPEWGLVNNAALVIGDRSLTKKFNLNARMFLHSYDWQIDQDGSILAAVFAGPVRVAYWINISYLFSSLNNSLYGAGSKITHNITGKRLTMQGNASDVMHGLPMQSLFNDYDNLNHQPVRLHVVIHAPREKIEEVVKHDEIILKLISNEWLFILSIDPSGATTYKLSRNLKWHKVEN